MELTDIAVLRLQAQHIAQADFAKPEAVVKHLLAMQAQDYPGALWSVGLRTKDSTLADVEQAIVDRKIVRTWPMRGTLHLMHADDAAWMVRLLASRATAAAKGRRLTLGLSDAVMKEVEALTRTELSGGKVIRRDDFQKLLREKVTGVKIEAAHYGHILRNFGEQGIVCFGPHDGKQPTFVLMDDWLPQPKEKNRDEALQELATRYFVSHGPATLKDFAGWTMLTMGDARKALELALPELESEVVSSTTYYFSRNLKLADTPSVFLLPGFDEYLLGYKDRSAALTAEHSQRIVPGNNGMFIATIILDGQVIGTWKKKVTKQAVTIEPEIFSPNFKVPPKLLSKAAERYGYFAGLVPKIT